MSITLPSPLPRPATDEYSAEAQYIRFFNEAIAFATLLNANALAVFKHQCEFWLENYAIYQNNKLPIPPKPTPPNGYIVDVVHFGSGVEPQAVLSQIPVADPCPDPAPDTKIVIPPPVDPVGEAFGGFQPWYRVMPGDLTPIGGQFTDARGMFTRSQSPTPFGAFQYWLLEKVAV